VPAQFRGGHKGGNTTGRSKKKKRKEKKNISLREGARQKYASKKERSGPSKTGDLVEKKILKEKKRKIYRGGNGPNKKENDYWEEGPILLKSGEPGKKSGEKKKCDRPGIQRILEKTLPQKEEFGETGERPERSRESRNYAS